MMPIKLHYRTEFDTLQIFDQCSPLASGYNLSHQFFHPTLMSLLMENMYQYQYQKLYFNEL